VDTIPEAWGPQAVEGDLRVHQVQAVTEVLTATLTQVLVVGEPMEGSLPQGLLEHLGESEAQEG
jgi:hypothetical protein